MGNSFKKIKHPWQMVLLVLLVAFVVWYDFQREYSDPVAERGVTTGTCVNVIDGDTIDVKTDDGDVIRIRLLGIDCMETHNEEKMAKQAERHGRSVKQIRIIGERARNNVRDSILNFPVSWEVPQGTPLRDPYDRLLAYVSLEGQDVGELLLKKGLAEVRRDEHPRAARYRQVAKPLMY